MTPFHCIAVASISLFLGGCSLIASSRPPSVSSMPSAFSQQQQQPDRYAIPREGPSATPDNAPYKRDGRFGTKPYQPGEHPYRAYPPGYVRYPGDNPPQ